MTIRTLINKKKRRFMAVVLVSLVMFVAGVMLANLQVLGGWSNLLVLPGLAIFLVTWVHGFSFAFRCPRCGAQWASLAMDMIRSPFKLLRSIRYCPYCGADIDADLAERKWG